MQYNFSTEMGQGEIIKKSIIASESVGVSKHVRSNLLAWLAKRKLFFLLIIIVLLKVFFIVLCPDRLLVYNQNRRKVSM